MQKNNLNETLPVVYPFNNAISVAEELLAKLKPFCEKIEIAGSLRRKKDFVKDIEIVCIPKRILDINSDFFNPNWIPIHEFSNVINSMKKIKGEPTGKYTRRIYKEIPVDIFMCYLENWGNTLLIRTGPENFSKYIMGVVLPQKEFIAKDNFIYNRGYKMIPLINEEDFFSLLQMDYLPPCMRH